MPRKPSDPPVTPQYIGTFLDECRWMDGSKHWRERAAYRMIRWLWDERQRLLMELAAVKGQEAMPSWTERTKAKKK